MNTTTPTTYADQLDRISETIDAFCTFDSNFDDDGTISERGMGRLVSFLETSVAEIGDEGIHEFYTRPRAEVLTSIGAVEEYRDADGKRQLRNKRKYTQEEAERAWHDAGNESLWAITDFLPRLKKGTPPHLSKDEVCAMLIAHRIVAAEHRETAGHA